MIGVRFSGWEVRSCFKSADTDSFPVGRKRANSAPYHSRSMMAFCVGVATPRYMSSRIQDASGCLIKRLTWA